MKSSAKKVELASVDDLFSTEESRADAQRERVLEIPLSELHPFKNHPFKVKDDESMMETADSIRQYGVLVPAIARPDPDGGYELVAGHRRHRASELADKETMPVIVRDLDDDAATIIMVDSNLQRESLLPSERAFAYKMKLDAMKHAENRLDTEAAVKDVLEKFGTERVQFILANTIQHKNHDGRISQDNKAWAKTIPMPEDSGASRHYAYLVVDGVNPGLTDLFTRQARKAMQEQQKSSVLQKLKQEPSARKPAAPKKREPER